MLLALLTIDLVHLQITLAVDLVYFLAPSSLKLLHNKYDVNYETLMKNTAQASLKVLIITY